MNSKKSTYLAIYVDDGIVCGKNPQNCLQVIESLNKVFSVSKVTGSSFLGMEITRTQAGLFISQRRYIRDILERFKMSECKGTSRPINDFKALFACKESAKITAPYREAIGCLIYLAKTTRPDLLFAATTLSKFNNDPRETHWSEVKHVLKYLKHTEGVGLLYANKPSDEITIDVYSDSDFAGNPQGRRSTSGYIVLINGCPVIFGSRQQSGVAQSSSEAEFVVANEATKELTWLITFLKELKVGFMQPKLHIDNKSAICCIKNNELRRGSKHIEIKYHYIREKYHENQFDLEYIETSNQLADFLTKNVKAPILSQLMRKANMIDDVKMGLVNNATILTSD